MTRIAIISAVPGELGPLVQGWPRDSRQGVDLWHRPGGGVAWIAGCAGIGVEAAGRAFGAIEGGGAVDVVVSAGWAGALREDLLPGRACVASGVVDSRTGERLACAGRPGECWVVTHHRIADQAEKRRLAAIAGAGLVDMEAAGLARLAAARGIPFHCVKGVSDGFADPLPDFDAFIAADGKFQARRFCLFTLRRPKSWPALLRLASHSRKAARAISRTLPNLLGPMP